MRTARSTRWKTCTLGLAAVAALVEAVSIGYQDRALGSNDDVAMLDVSFPKELGALNVGPHAKTTYWNRDLRAVEDILFRSGASGS